MANRGTLNKEWEKFAKSCIPSGASDGVHEYMKMAFYAGAASFNNALSECAAAGDPDAEITDEEKAYMEELEAEVVDFAASVVLKFSSPGSAPKN